MSNQLLPYDTIIKAHEGDPIAIQAVLDRYAGYIRYTHDTYCRIVIRHASFDAARMLAARWKQEISLEYLTEEKFVPFSTTDEYFSVPDYGETYPFSVRGQLVLLDNCALTAALARLPEQTQEEMEVLSHE